MFYTNPFDGIAFTQTVVKLKDTTLLRVLLKKPSIAKILRDASLRIKYTQLLQKHPHVVRNPELGAMLIDPDSFGYVLDFAAGNGRAMTLEGVKTIVRKMANCEYAEMVNMLGAFRNGDPFMLTEPYPAAYYSQIYSHDNDVYTYVFSGLIQLMCCEIIDVLLEILAEEQKN